MKNSEEMYQYCLDNKLGQGFNKSLALKHFKLVEQNLLPDEEIIVPFIGIHNYKDMTHHDNNYAYALTNKRFIMAQKKLFGSNIQTVLRKNINDFTYSTKALLSIVTVDTLSGSFNIALGNHEFGRNIYNYLENELTKE